MGRGLAQLLPPVIICYSPATGKMSAVVPVFTCLANTARLLGGGCWDQAVWPSTWQMMQTGELDDYALAR